MIGQVEESGRGDHDTVTGVTAGEIPVQQREHDGVKPCRVVGLQPRHVAQEALELKTHAKLDTCAAASPSTPPITCSICMT